MANLRISEDIRPISELKSKAAEIVQQIGNSGRPVVLTRNGRGVAVMLSVDQYDELQQAATQWRMLEALRQAESELEAGLGVPHAEVAAKWLGSELE